MDRQLATAWQSLQATPTTETYLAWLLAELRAGGESLRHSVSSRPPASVQMNHMLSMPDGPLWIATRHPFRISRPTPASGRESDCGWQGFWWAASLYGSELFMWPMTDAHRLIFPSAAMSVKTNPDLLPDMIVSVRLTPPPKNRARRHKNLESFWQACGPRRLSVSPRKEP